MQSILKQSKMTMSEQAWDTPMQPRPLMLPDNETDVSLDDVVVCINSTIRKEAIARYESDNPDLDFVNSDLTVSILSRTSIYLFERDDPTMCARMQVPAEEDLVTGDLRNSFAARAVDILLSSIERGGAEHIKLLGSGYLRTTLERYHKVSSGEVMAPAELKHMVLEQLQDLEQRCEARLQDIGGERQFNVRSMMKEMAVDAEYRTEEEEQDYEEALINRKPDVLAQRYLRHRVGAQIVGLDVSKKLLRNIRTLLSSPLLV